MAVVMVGLQSHRTLPRLASAFMARIASAQWVELDSRGERNQYRDTIWDMLVDTYREIGVKPSSKSAMDK